METLRILAADDHEIVRRGLVSLIASHPGWEVCGEATTGREAVEKNRQLRPDVVVMDLNMPGMGGVEATIQIRKEFRTARIIVLTTYEGDEDIHRALEAGAHGYLLKASARKELVQTIREVLAGHKHISPAVAKRLAEHTPRMALTDRELQVLNHIAKGLRNKEIGAALNIAEDTVKIHIKNIFGKLNVIDRTAAVVSASQRGIIELDYAH